MMLFILLTQPKAQRKKQSFAIGLFIALILLAVVMGLENSVKDQVTMVGWRYLFSITGYVFRPILVAMMIVVVDERFRKNFLFWIPVIVNALFYISCPITHLCFWFDEEVIFQEGPLYLTMLVVCIIYTIVLIYELYAVFISRELSEVILLILAAAFAIGGAILDMFVVWNGFFFLSTLALAMIIYYLYIHVQRDREDEIKRLIELQEKQNELTQKNAELMTSQIQPHFLYNTLASIQYLIRKKPEVAEEALSRFTLYLRGNMNAIGKTKAIPFERELEHVENYVFIEKMRFPGISVEYDIQDEIFDLPPLTLQPLVENSIKHGIRGEKQGKVLVKTYYENDAHVIVVQDNGVGFEYKENTPHIGLSNVKTRLEYMVDGTMTVESEVGKGTTVTVYIPEKEVLDENLFD